MTLVVVGSTALKQHLPLIYWREPTDEDVWTDQPMEEYSLPLEVFWDERLREWFGDCQRFATLDELYTIKASHAYWELKNGSWNKHMYDLLRLKQLGAVLIQPLHDILYPIWEEKHGKKMVDLNQESMEFFSDAVKRIYDHDSIHDSVAFGDEALYIRTLADGHTVKVDSKKMWGLGFDNLIRLFREEIYATALERLLIPTNYEYSAGAAYLWSLRRTITSLTKGKSAQFIVDNFDLFSHPYEVLGEPDNYLARHLSKREKLIKL